MGSFCRFALRSLWTRTVRSFHAWSGAALVALMAISLSVALTACESSSDAWPPTTVLMQYAGQMQMQQPISARPAKDLLAPPTQTPTHTPNEALDSLPVRLSGVPVYSQLTTLPVSIGGKRVATARSSCGPTALAMVLNYQHTGPTPQDIVEAAFGAGLYRPNDPERVYTSPENLYILATRYGMAVSGNAAKDDKAAQALLREMLNRNLPVIVDVTVALRANEGTSAHFVVVTGMDAEDVYVNDPYTGGTGGSLRIVTFKDFIWAWQHNSDAAKRNGGGWWMTVVPQ